MQEKRQIKSAAELVNALDKNIRILKDSRFIVDFDEFEEWHPLTISIYCRTGSYTYSDPVEVVELWGSCDDHDQWSFEDVVKEPTHTHKQTQIHLNNKIIWTETEKI